MQSNTEQTQPVIEYGVTEAALSELRNTYLNVPDANTTEGYEEIKEALKVLTPLRTGVEKKRKELKADALAWGKKVDGEAKRITEALLEIETPFKSAKTEVDERKKREKEERIARLQKKVDAISAYPQTALGQPSSVIADLIEELDKLEIEDFYDLTKEAAAAKTESLDKLTEMLQTTIAQERQMEEQKLEQARQAEERERLEQERKQLEADRAELDRLRSQQSSTEPLVTEASPAPLFHDKQIGTCITSSSDLEHLCQFFGEEGVGDMRFDEDGNEYELEVIVRRTSLKQNQAA